MSSKGSIPYQGVQAIVDQQRQFFDHGEVAMRPLTPGKSPTHWSCTNQPSRVTNQKYMATARGVYEPKYFLAVVATDIGGAASSTAIRALIASWWMPKTGRNRCPMRRLPELLGQQGIVAGAAHDCQIS